MLCHMTGNNVPEELVAFVSREEEGGRMFL
jgi:hypothetical protein